MGEYLPTVLMYDFLSISEKDAAKIVQRLEARTIPDQGAWGSVHPAGNYDFIYCFLLTPLLFRTLNLSLGHSVTNSETKNNIRHINK
jgi:hypothetical protein